MTNELGVKHKKKWLAVMLAFWIGSTGAHKFYLGHPKIGAAYLTVTLGLVLALGLVFGSGEPPSWIFVLAIPGWLGVVEAILYIVKSKQDFHRIYVQDGRSMF